MSPSSTNCRSLPGVAMSTLAPFLIWSLWCEVDVPPYATTDRIPDPAENLRLSSLICTASSRVGEMTTASGVWTCSPPRAPNPPVVMRLWVESRYQGHSYDFQLGVSPIEDGEEEGRRLARSGLSAGHEVAALANDGNGVLLHRGRSRVVALLHVLSHDVGEAWK